MERLHKKIASYGYTSRRKAEKLILEKRVMVDDKVITELGFKVSHRDVIKIDGEVINKSVIKKYYLLNKPRDVISSVKDEAGRITVTDLIDEDEKIYPVGRLDYDTTGLIILTNDGEFANYIAHPKSEISKTYLAKIDKILTKPELKALKSGINIDGREVNIKNIRVEKKDILKNTSYVELTLIEGRNHIVKNIFSSAGCNVLKLKRIAIGEIKIDNLKSGEYRHLNPKEIKILLKKKSR